MNWLKKGSKTVWGGLLMGVCQVLPLLDLGVFGPKAQAVGQGLAAILVATGVRGAIAKNGQGQ